MIFNQRMIALVKRMSEMCLMFTKTANDSDLTPLQKHQKQEIDGEINALIKLIEAHQNTKTVH